MRRFLLSPRWLAGHLLVLAAAATCLWLGWWQWERAHEVGGGAQNLGYALQWPLFAGFVIFAWVKMARLETARRESPPSNEPAKHQTVPVWRYEPPVIDDEDDEELAAYNRHLAALNTRDQQAER